MIMGSPGMGFITPADAACEAQRTSAMQQMMHQNLFIVPPLAGGVLSQFGCPCTVLCPALGFKKNKCVGGECNGFWQDPNGCSAAVLRLTTGAGGGGLAYRCHRQSGAQRS